MFTAELINVFWSLEAEEQAINTRLTDFVVHVHVHKQLPIYTSVFGLHKLLWELFGSANAPLCSSASR